MGAVTLILSDKRPNTIIISTSGLYYKTIKIVIDAPSVIKSDAANCSVTY
jgi:hypothetical protein